eukprot:8344275-Alexandrium_andersonii.AAC.1
MHLGAAGCLCRAGRWNGGCVTQHAFCRKAFCFRDERKAPGASWRLRRERPLWDGLPPHRTPSD